MSGRGIATDVRSRSKLQPILGQISRSAAVANAPSEGQSEEYLDAMEEALNVRVDGEVDLLASGLAELVAMARIERKDHFQVAQDSFHANIRTESIVSRSFPAPFSSSLPTTFRQFLILHLQIRAAQNLLSLTHSLKLLHLFEDNEQGTENRERESTLLREQIATLKREIATPTSQVRRHHVYVVSAPQLTILLQ